MTELLIRWWRRWRDQCETCGTELLFGDNIYEDMTEHWYCPNEYCIASDLYTGEL